MPDYANESKNKVREQMLSSAIVALTSMRHSSELIARDEHACCNTTRTAGELKVLYLCGPSPSNGLRVLLEHGINIHKIAEKGRHPIRVRREH